MQTQLYFPDYRGGSLVNLMSSILKATGGASPYAPLTLLPPESLASAKNIVLMVIDGFGYEFLMRQAEQTVFHRHLAGKITSIFPSTTAAGITTFLTGLAPQQHAVTGWFMLLKELGCVATTLKFQPRCCEASLLRKDVTPPALYGNGTSLFAQMRRATYSVDLSTLVNTDYNSRMNDCPRKRSFSTFPECLQQLGAIITQEPEPKFIYAYWDAIDALSHVYGACSIETVRHFYEISDALDAWLEQLRGTDTTLIITADHGLIDTDMTRTIQVKQHPALRETLTLPMCAEARVAFCYVRPSKTAQFEQYIQREFDGICDLYRSEALIEKGLFGLFEADPRLFDRIGDYAIIMRSNYVIRDFLLGEKETFYVGYHGGLSAEEMFVPLIVMRL